MRLFRKYLRPVPLQTIAECYAFVDFKLNVFPAFPGLFFNHRPRAQNEHSITWRKKVTFSVLSKVNLPPASHHVQCNIVSNSILL